MMTYKECGDILTSAMKDPKGFEELCTKNPDKALMIFLTTKEALNKCHEMFEMDMDWKEYE